MRFLTLFLFSIAAWAQVQIQVIDPNLDTSSIEKKYQVRKQADQYSALPDRKTREDFFQDVISVRKLDELTKDILFMDLKDKSISSLTKIYPFIPEIDLNHMKARRK